MADVTIASTTDDQEAVNIAAGLPAGGPEEEVEQQEPEAEEEPKVEAKEEVEAEREEESEEEESQPQRKSGWQKRVDKLTARNYSLEEELESQRTERRALEDRLAKLEANAGKKDEPAANQFSKPRPQSKDFEDYDKFTDALTDWKLEEKEFKTAQAKTVEAQAVQAEHQKQTFAEYNKAVSSFKAEHDDFDEVVGREDLTLPISVQVAIVGMGKAGPEVSYALASDEEACSMLSEIAQTKGDPIALTEFGRWLAANTETEEEPARPAKRAAAPPKPIKPVGASSTKSSVAIDEMDYRDFRRLRDDQEKARHRH